ncbi:RAMP superfamily CRISPR-associated protein [Corallococcus macrosporus]|uniref:CRISPR-associated protein Cmr1 n=1 Tax=Corallococcus macrosporus DSM 14697 TaxID=1189310 RepID=A0A286NVZ6_9BACT|nr:RAMP superfamily CRISPR-associated protein [Corallococcus macrosporus]ATB51341.1 CRISPR-associated protein Cmr1 [Corallococcus macrosporus DSM 14697]
MRSLLDLPEPDSTDLAHLRRRSASAPRLETFTLALKTITPILGGGPVARSPELPSVDIIRVPTLRGHLRFWWRALYGHAYVARGTEGAWELARKERELWGGMGRAGGVDDAGPRRSQVELRVTEVQQAQGDSSDVDRAPRGVYALWPAITKPGLRDLPRWRPGLRFTLEVVAPEGEAMLQVRNAVRAWILFGGYGSRGRRGCGSVDVATGDKAIREQWLPAEASREALRQLMGGLPLFLARPEAPRCDMPLLQDAFLYRAHRRAPYSSGVAAWEVALQWLRDFRQGTESWGDGLPLPARNPKKEGREGRSNWPEADKIRRFARPSPKDEVGTATGRAYPEEHAPRPGHSASPAWPRAGFGLPIAFRFQRENKHKTPYSPQEPVGCVLQWARKNNGKWERMDRLASPLIVKAMPLSNGQFEPVALWLHRGTPVNGRVVVVQGKAVLSRSEVAFERSFRASDDQPLFSPLQRADNLRDAFFQWLKDTQKAQEA